ncbi:3-(3-hydroxy-phenyl)propionate/3-hydroxycinnamic acid hydroxylase [Kaistia sp. 32K]|nr:3-(3-hydroxy-phenyl)propionate/3-hydroxycinnamic acid hydroxylase [Kaistia sp. 32K]
MFDVLIAGAGPAGLTMANLLGQAGVRVLLIERDPGLSEIPKALLIDDEFFRLLATLGLSAPVSAHGVYPISFDYYSPMGWRVGHVEPSITEHHYSRRTATFQPEFEAILLAGGERFPTFEARFRHELVDFEQDADGVVATLATPEGEARVRARYLIGADGSHSLVRKKLGIPFDEVRKFGDRHIVVDVLEDPDTSPVAVTKLGWSRNYVSLPSPNGGRRYEVSLHEHETDDAALLEDAALARMLAPICDDIRTRRVIRKAIYTFHSRIARRLSAGRVHLVGDAAHVMPIFGSQGMNSGARDVKNLGWKLAEVVHGRALPSLLDSYHEERFEHLVETIKIATANGKLQSARMLPVTMARDLFLGAASLIPAFSRWIRDMRYIPKPYLKSGIVLHDGRPDPKSLVGRVLPNPAVVSDGGAEMLLDDLLGPGFALVGLDVAEAPAGALRHPFLDPARISRVALRPEGAPAPRAAEGVVTAALADHRLSEAIAFHAGKWLLVRPDRIVAAALAPADLAAGAGHLSRLLAGEASPEPASVAA